MDNLVRFTLQVHITSACDAQCAHCYQRGIEPAFMSLHDFRLLMQQMDDLAQKLAPTGEAAKVLVTITGGEPLMHPRFREMVMAVRRHGFQLAVLTNGHLIDQSMAVLLRNAKFVQVSLDGDEAAHDAVRGEGDYQRVMAAIRTLRAARANPMVSFTAHAQNYRALPAAVAAAKKAGANRFWSDRYLPLGDDPAFEPLDPQQTVEWLQLLAEASNERNSIVMRHRALQFQCGGMPYACHAGADILAVGEDCQVYPCRRLPLPCGDFRETPLQELYESHPTIVELRDFDHPDTCASCGNVETCGGGLRCFAAAVEGDWRLTDPGCPIAYVRADGDRDIKQPEKVAAKKLKQIKSGPPRFRGVARAARSLKRTFGGGDE